MGIFGDLGSGIGSLVRGAGSVANAVGDPFGTLGVSRSPQEVAQDRIKQLLALPQAERPALIAKWKQEDSFIGKVTTSLIPESALGQVGKVPVIGGETKRMLGGLTSPVGLLATLATLGTGAVAGAGARTAASLAYSTGGSFAAGLLGQALETTPLDFRLRLPTPVGETNLGPRAIGEIVGGFKGGPKGTVANLAEETAGEASHLPSIDPVVNTQIQKLTAKVSDAPLHEYDAATHARGGNLAPPRLETNWQGFYDGILADQVGPGPLRALPAPMRKVLDLASEGLALRGGSAEWVGLNFRNSMEEVLQGANYAVIPLVQIEKQSGSLNRAGGVWEKLAGAGVPLSDQPIPGLATGKGGLLPTWKNHIEHPSAFPDSPAIMEQGRELYNANKDSIYDGAKRSLQDYGFTSSEIEDILPKTEANYFHRIAVDEQGNRLNAPTRHIMGGKHAFQQERVPEELLTGETKYIDSPAASLQDYAAEVGHVVLLNTYFLPAMKRMGIHVSAFAPPEFAADLGRLRAERSVIASARKLAYTAKFDRSQGDVARRARDLLANDISDDLRSTIERLATPLDDARAAPIAREVENQLREAAIANKDAIMYAADQSKLVQKMNQRGRYRMLDIQKFPALSQFRFDANFARQIEQNFKRAEPPEGVWNTISQYQNLIQAAQAGTADAGYFGLQLLPMINPRTAALIPSIARRMFSDEATRAFILKADTRLSQSGESMASLAKRARLRMGVEVASPLDTMQRPAPPTKVLGRLLQNWPVNRAMTNAINMGRQSIFEDRVRLVEAMKRGVPITDEELQAVGRNASMSTGHFNWTRAGISPGQQTFEKVALRFAPGWFRSQMKMIVTAASPTFGVDQKLARYTLASTYGTILGLYVATGALIGQTPNLNPLDPKTFLTYTVKGQRVGPGGPILAFMRTAGTMATLAEKAATGDPDALNRLVDIRDSGNPLTKMWRQGAPTLTGLLYDIVKGREAYGDNALGPDHAKNTALAFLQSIEPFAIQAARTDGLASAAGQFLGGRAFPMSETERFSDAADEKAKSLGFASWIDVPKATQADLIRNDADLAELQTKMREYSKRFPSAKDAAFQQVDDSRAAVEDMTLASWAGVQAGTVSLPDFRKHFSDLMAQHAWLYDRAITAAGYSADKPMDDETKQDFYARQYAAIQPEQFDKNQDGVITEGEWQDWRAARQQFWNDNPDASNYRSYITVDFHTKQWSSPEMAAIAKQRYEALDQYDQYLQIPKYRGLSDSDASFIDTVRSLKSKVTSELRAQVAQQAGPEAANKIEIPARQAWALALQTLQQSGAKISSRQGQLLNYAIALDKQQVKTALINPERVAYLQQHPAMVQWYSGAAADAGLSAVQIAAMGLGQPQTTSSDILDQLKVAA